MAEAGAALAQAQAKSRAKLIEEKALLFAKDGMTPSANNHAGLFKLVDPTAKVVQHLGMFLYWSTGMFLYWYRSDVPNPCGPCSRL